MIEVEALSKEYNYSTIFENITETFSLNERIAVLGENGSGKSTLLKVLSGMVTSTRGQIQWQFNGQLIPPHQWYQYFSFSSPQLFFGDHLTVSEIFDFFMQLKPFQSGMSPEKAIERIGFQAHRHKPMKSLSSGMYQRIRLILSICSDVPVLFLDEPCSNLDDKGIDLYHELITEFGQKRLILVASNDEREYHFCQRRLAVNDYK